MKSSNDNFQFRLNDLVEHTDGAFHGVVTFRAHTTRRGGLPGPDVYEIELIHGPFAGQKRVILGSYLCASEKRMIVKVRVAVAA